MPTDPPGDQQALDEAAAATPFMEIGRTGLRQWSGIIFEEFLTELDWVNGRRIFREMRDNDPTVGAFLYAIEMLVRGVEWRMKPFGSDDPEEETTDEDKEVAKFVESCFGDMTLSWGDTLASMLSFLPFGFSLHEEVYKKRGGFDREPNKRSKFSDGKIGWAKIPIRAQDTIERWIFDSESGDWIGAVQRALPDFKTRILPRNRMLLFRTTSTKENPEGRSLLRNAYRPWYFKKRIEEIEGIGIERDLAGLPVAFVPPELLYPDASAEQKAILDSITRTIRNVRRDEKEGIVFPLVRDDKGNLLYDFKLMNSGGRRQFDTVRIIDRYDSRISMTVLADFLLMGHEKVGSFALASSKTNIFAASVGAILSSIASVFNKDAIPNLLDLNNMSLERLPTLQNGDIETVELGELGEFLQRMSVAGANLFPDEDMEAWVRRQMGAPAKTDETKKAQEEEAEAAETARQEALERGPIPPAGLPPAREGPGGNEPPQPIRPNGSGEG